MNEIINCDCLEYLKDKEKECFDLIYLDPPFFTQVQQKSSDNEFQFEDRWNSRSEYIEYMKERFIELHRTLKNTGTIFVHCDRKASHYLKIVLDEVFGEENYLNDIVWYYKRWSNSKKGLLNSHQVILFYSKSKGFKFNKLYTDYSSTTNVDQILQSRKRDDSGKTVYDKDDSGNFVHSSEKKGVPLSDVWEIPFLNPKAKERVNYPTQKPIELLEKIISLCSNEGDVIYDPFCGSGTTLVAAKLLKRTFVGTDISSDAVNLAKSRIDNPIKTESHLLKKGYKSYENKNEEITNILKSNSIKIVHRNKGIDGITSNDKNPIIPVKVCLEDSYDDSLNLLVNATKKKNLNFAILLVNKNDVNKIGVIKIDDVEIVTSLYL